MGHIAVRLQRPLALADEDNAICLPPGLASHLSWGRRIVCGDLHICPSALSEISDARAKGKLVSFPEWTNAHFLELSKVATEDIDIDLLRACPKGAELLLMQTTEAGVARIYDAWGYQLLSPISDFKLNSSVSFVELGFDSIDAGFLSVLWNLGIDRTEAITTFKSAFKLNDNGLFATLAEAEDFCDFVTDQQSQHCNIFPLRISTVIAVPLSN